MKNVIMIVAAVLLSSAAFAQKAEFKFEEITHDFGNILEGPEATYEFKFTNVGSEPLIIQSCSASCGCTTPNWSKDPIMPGKTGTIKVRFASKGRIGSFNKTIYIQSNAKSDKERYELYIKGVVIPKAKVTGGVKMNPSEQ
jgi:hypothetical protein